MRFVGRASLPLSVALIAAIVMAFLIRTAELERSRDAQLRHDAEVGAEQFAALVDEVSIAASVGNDRAEVVRAVLTAESDRGVCVVDAEGFTCDGVVQPPDRVVRQLELERDGRSAAGRSARVTAFDGQIVVDAVGPDVSVLVAVPISLRDRVFPSTYLPVSASDGEFFEDGQVRQIAVAVPGADGVFVVATADTEVALGSSELRLYLVAFAIGLVFLALAGVTLVIEHRSLVDRATFDQLTRLPNRSEFTRRASELLDPDDPVGDDVCVLLFDLDGFKEVNDTYGHTAGDEMLRVIGERLHRAVRRGDLVGRWGGDEFVVLLRGVGTPEMGSRRARDLAADVGGRTRLDGVPEALRVKASVGVAIRGLHGRDLASLVEAADRAMYEAKRNGLPSSVAPIGGPSPIRV